jgi:hypothetical protein
MDKERIHASALSGNMQHVLFSFSRLIILASVPFLVFLIPAYRVFPKHYMQKCPQRTMPFRGQIHHNETPPEILQTLSARNAVFSFIYSIMGNKEKQYN